MNQRVHGEELAVLELDTLVVSERFSLDYAGDVDLNSTPVFFSTVNREEFDAGSTGIADTIQSLTGIQVRQSGGIGSYSTASLRGSSADQVLIFMDGILLNSAGRAEIDLNSIALSDIDAIEIYRGITPFEFSAASIGGAINLRTRRLDHERAAHLTASTGSFGTRRLSGLWRNQVGAADYLISLDQLNSQNDFHFINDNGTRYNSRDDSREHRNNNDVQQTNAMVKTGFGDDTAYHVNVHANWFAKDQGIASWNNNPATRTRFATEKGSGQVSLHSGSGNNERSQWSLRAHYQTERETYDDRASQIGLGAQHNEYLNRNYGLDFISKSRLGLHQLGLQLNGKQDSFHDRDLLGVFQTLHHRRDSLALALQDTIQDTKQDWLISASARAQQNRDHTEGNSRFPASDTDKQFITGQAGIKLGISPHWKIKANGGSFVREPTFFELFGDRGLFLGNAELREERSNNFDVGLKYSDPDHFLFGHTLNLELSVFHNRLRDAIVTVYDSRGTGRAENISRAQISGIEGSLHLGLSTALSTSFSFTHQRSVNEDARGWADNKQLPGRYVNAAAARLDYDIGPINCYLAWQHESGAYYDTANLLPVADKDIVNSGISYQYQAVLLAFAVNNLADQRYEDFNGYPRPGRSWLFTVNYEIQ